MMDRKSTGSKQHTKLGDNYQPSPLRHQTELDASSGEESDVESNIEQEIGSREEHQTSHDTTSAELQEDEDMVGTPDFSELEDLEHELELAIGDDSTQMDTDNRNGSSSSSSNSNDSSGSSEETEASEQQDKPSSAAVDAMIVTPEIVAPIATDNSNADELPRVETTQQS
jgi:hypothetical protein